MTLLERMDRLVYATRIDRVIFMKLEPRAFRWTPLLVISALITGFAMMARTRTPLVADFFIGWLLFYGAILAAYLLRALGPRFMGTADRPLDERELMVKARAHAASGVVLALIFSLGCFYMTTAGVPGLWHPQFMDWFNLGFGVQGISILLPTWIASWLEPRPAADSD
jgi:hypothetical protein